MLDLRPYQASAIEAITTADREGVRRPLVVHPTGTGKTVTFCHLIARRAGIGRALVLVHRDELANQTVDKIGMVAPELTTGIVKAERNDVSADVVVASVQTIHRDNRLAALLAAGRWRPWWWMRPTTRPHLDQGPDQAGVFLPLRSSDRRVHRHP